MDIGMYSDGQKAHGKLLNIITSLRNAIQNYNEVSITSHQSEWRSSESLQMVNAREGLEKREPSYPVHGLENCYTDCEEQYRHPSKSKNRAAIWSSNPANRHISRENHNSKKIYAYDVHGSII